MASWVVFEDEHFADLLPLTYFRPVWELRCGARTILEKLRRATGGEPNFLARTYLIDHYLKTASPEAHVSEGEEILLANGRWLMRAEDAAEVHDLAPGEALSNGHDLLACCVSGRTLRASLKEGVVDSALLRDACIVKQHEGITIRYPWDAVSRNGEEIVRDWSDAQLEPRFPSDLPGVHLLEPGSIHIDETARIDPGVVLDARQGPVWIDANVVVMANAVLEGPLYVGKGSRVKVGAKIYESTTIGPVCKVGGEVEASIILGYSNKQHDGFLGHAYLGHWVNLGADTNNSDLKNNYGEITVPVNGEPVNTHMRFFGATVGDHTKTAINTMLNTGTVIGVNCNVFGASMPPRFIPSFSWGGGDAPLVSYDFSKATAVAKTVMSRRGIEFDESQKAVFGAVRALAARMEKGFIQ